MCRFTAQGMEGLLSSREFVLNGIVNGIDCDEEWNPEKDKHLPAHYTADNFSEGKRTCKLALQVSGARPWVCSEWCAGRGLFSSGTKERLSYRD